MSDKYAEVVVSCLTCLDTSSPDFSDESEFTDDDDVVVGVRYIEKMSRKTHVMKAENKGTELLFVVLTSHTDTAETEQCLSVDVNTSVMTTGRTNATASLITSFHRRLVCSDFDGGD
jgi:hypothetical protein